MIQDAYKTVRSDVESYCQDILSGARVSNRLVQLAVQRHVDDLESAEERGFYFDERIAAESCVFFPATLRHTKGEWAGKPFHLSDSQKFITWCLFGWRKKSNDCRRFNRALIEVSRKWGKSEWASGITLKLGTFDEPLEPGAEVYLAATKEDQVRGTTFLQCKRMVEKSPGLRRIVDVFNKSITTTPTSPQPDAFIKPIGSDSNTSDGFDLHGAILDELHAWQKHQQGFYERMTTAGGSRRQELVCFVTTAGDDRSELYIRLHDYFVRVLESVETGDVVSDHHFAFIACLDEGDDPLAHENSSTEFRDMMSKANPNYPMTPKHDYLAQQANEARENPIERNKFMRFHGNVRVSSSIQPISSKLWSSLEVDSFESNLPSQGKHGGIDLGRTDDFAAKATCEQFGKGDESLFYIEATSYTCSERAKTLNTTQIANWIEAGDLVCHAGNAVSFQLVQDDIVGVEGVLTWAFDPQFAAQMGQNLVELLGEDVPFKFTQSATHYNEPCVKFIRYLKQGRIRVKRNKCLAWQARNLSLKTNAAGLAMPDKGIGDEYKIDAMVAILMAFSECLFADDAYESYEKGSCIL